MLKEAAPENDRLADYYERVTRRVKGHGDEAEQNDGVGVGWITVRPPSRSSAVRSQVSSQGLVGGGPSGVVGPTRRPSPRFPANRFQLCEEAAALSL